MNIPKINFEMMSLDEVVKVLSWTIFKNDGILPLREETLKLYPSLNNILKELDDNKNDQNIVFELIKNNIKNSYLDFINKNFNLPLIYNNIWKEYNDDYMNAISSCLNIPWPNNIDIIEVKIGNIPVAPRNIKNHSFKIGDVDASELIEICMHECCHFLFFEKCKELFKDVTYGDFKSPNLMWYLSEIVIDPILNQDIIQKLFKHDFKSYDEFYEININDKNLMTTVKEIFNSIEIDNVIIKTFEFLKENEESFK